MSQVFFYPPVSATNASIGANGATAPSSSTEVGGIGLDGNLHALSTDNSGVLNVNAATLPLPSGAATAAKQDTGNASLALITARLSGSLVPLPYDEIALTYVPSGNGAGQIATAVYKLASATQATLTMTYDSSDRLTDVIKS